MHVQLLYFDGCPNWQVAQARLRDALVAVGAVDVVELVEVTTQEQAERLGFRGSPSVIVDGRDLFWQPDAGVGLVCRVYSTPEGLGGAPTTAQLVEALRAGAGG
ncbi:thioredoxin family protein [Demequina sp.]|uniref:DF family (seleno)protein n=1 Tax=Demequina sp. TaxID=2050685 RepID=UPI0025C2B0A1|nr:thioredoxin family protein [Demequina sp.]